MLHTLAVLRADSQSPYKMLLLLWLQPKGKTSLNRRASGSVPISKAQASIWSSGQGNMRICRLDQPSLSDLFSIMKGDIKKPFGIAGNKRKSIKCYNLNNYTNSLYLRFEVKDKPGVLSTITNRLAKYKISVKRLIQTPDKKNNKATIVIITHKTNELNAKNCLSVFKKDKNVLKYPTLIRIYN